AVSAPAALGVPLIQVLRLIEPVCRSGKLQAADLVEFNPRFDEGLRFTYHKTDFTERCQRADLAIGYRNMVRTAFRAKLD
ncbi:arginase family protein, partial [Salmonella enterica subsp. enterica serovar Kentucky]|nr:arginase family protein [Salmonella enterica subsp. enterica serovar Kentucky]